MHYLHEKAAVFFATCLVSLAPAFPISWLTLDSFFFLTHCFPFFSMLFITGQFNLLIVPFRNRLKCFSMVSFYVVDIQVFMLGEARWSILLERKKQKVQTHQTPPPS
jgi:hypothetical protein